MTLKVLNSNQIKGSLQVLGLLVLPIAQHRHNAHKVNWQLLVCPFA